MKYTDIQPEFFRESVLAKFWSKVDRSGGPNACWPWKGSFSRKRGCKKPGAYGHFFANGQQYYAHRVAYVLGTGRLIPDGYTIDHVKMLGCGGNLCCNFLHLEPVTQAVNSARHQATLPQLEQCPAGHEPRPRGTGTCRKCRTQYVAATQRRYPEKYKEMRRLQKRKERAKKKALAEVLARIEAL